MIGIALHRSLSWTVACSVLGQLVEENTIHGRQGKSAAFGRAHVVGWISCFCRLATNLRWRFYHFPQRFQLSRRHRYISKGLSR